MKIAIGGDVCIMSDCCGAFASGEGHKTFNDVLSVFSKADFSIVNVECAITESENAIKKIGPNLKAPIGTAKSLKKAGITHASLSNNHIFDFGIEGAADTVKYLEENGIITTGLGKNRNDARRDLIISDGKIKVAVIAVCEHEFSYALDNRMGAREYDPYDTMDDIVSAKKKADYVVVLYHGGKESCLYPSERLLKLCRSMIKHGADAVLCQHSHCIGCYEEYEGGHILYGQGNFHFVHDEWAGEGLEREMWNTGLVAVLDFNGKCNIELIPTEVYSNGIRLAPKERKEDILKGLYERSHSLKNGEYLKKFEEFCKTVEGVYGFIPQDIRELFAHYLDCEAHSDVWRILYKTCNHTNELN